MQAVQSHLVESSFQDQSCKLLRVAARCLNSLISSIFLSVVAAGACLLLQHSCAKDYFSKAGYHFERMVGAIIGYATFGSRLINFGINHSGPTEDTVLNARFEQWYCSASSDRLPIDRSKLKHISSGICLGISMDFISRYLKLLQRSTDHAACVRQVSQLFCEKGTIEAQITQILYEAQDMQVLRKSLTNDFYRVQSQLKQTSRSIDQITEETTPQELERILNQSVVVKLPTEQEIREIRYKQLAKNLCLDVSLTKSFEGTGTVEELDGLLQSLEPGAYILVNKYKNSKKGHAMAYIKISNEIGYLHDPKYGTGELGSQAASMLYDAKAATFFFACKAKV